MARPVPESAELPPCGWHTVHDGESPVHPRYIHDRCATNVRVRQTALPYHAWGQCSDERLATVASGGCICERRKDAQPLYADIRRAAFSICRFLCGVLQLRTGEDRAACATTGADREKGAFQFGDEDRAAGLDGSEDAGVGDGPE